MVPSVTSRPLGVARVFWAALPEFDVTATRLGSVLGSASGVTGVHDRVKGVYATFDGPCYQKPHYRRTGCIINKRQLVGAP